MVGTAQADSFKIFIKKIGYSVGLENLLERATDFGSFYGTVPSFRINEWTLLVRDRWKLKTGHVADFFSALEIAQIRNNEVFAGPIGEALGVCRKILDDSQFSAACRFLVALAIVHSDGDVFLNALSQQFDRTKIASALGAMVHEKRTELFSAFRAMKDREAIATAVSIEVQKANRGGGSKGKLSELTRGVPLSQKLGPMGLPKPLDIHHVAAPSDDYVHKISVTRKGWAEDLDFFRDGQLTDMGISFLSRLGRAHWASTGRGIYRVWPTMFEVESNQFHLEGLSALELPSTWEFQLKVFEALGGEYTRAPTRGSDLRSLAGDISDVYRHYKGLSQNRSMIRNEISSTVVTAVLLAVAFARRSPVSDLDKVLRSDEIQSLGIVVRSSRAFDLAIMTRQR